MLRKSKFALLTLVLVLVLAQVAFAGLSAVSPFNPPVSSNGFPQWYTDANGVSVDLPIPPIGNLLTPPTMIYAPLTAQSNLVAQRAGFDTEGFYFNARPDPKGFQTAYGKIACTFGLEASYANLIPTDGQQVVFARIRIKAPLKVAGSYTFTHPWGVETILVTDNDIIKNKGMFFTKDVGLTLGWIDNGGGIFSPTPSPGGFYTVLQPGNTMSTFLRQLSPAPPLGWIGDGVSLATVTGGTNGNSVTLSGPDPNLDGKNHNFVTTNLFVVSGHIPTSTAVPVPLSVDRVTCSHLGTVEYINLFLTAKQGANVQVTDAVTNAILFTGPVTDVSGKFYQSFPGVTKTITVTVSAAGFTTTAKTVPVVDYINITLANYSQGGNSLTVTATSSDFLAGAATNPALTVTGFGAMTVNTTTGVYTLGPVAVTTPLPPSISVTSTVGGSDTTPTAIVQ